jgi:hypothetical protein
MKRTLVATSAALLVLASCSFLFVYAAVSTLCDEDYWPDW